MPVSVHLATALMVLLAGYLPLSTAFAFGPTGHRLAGRVAEDHLCPPAAGRVRSLLGGQSLAEAGQWADLIRGDPAWAHSRPWHYIDVGDRASLGRASRASPDNVLAALARFEARLRDTRRSAEERAEALRFVVHLVVDIHQPLHVGRPGDRGGNLVPIVLGDKSISLHALWDGEALLAGEADAAWPRTIQVTGPWAAAGPEAWAAESRAMRPFVYDLPSGPAPALGPAYLARARQLLRLRLAQAGVRLATRLNAALGCDAG